MSSVWLVLQILSLLENRELEAVAGKYEIIGKKKEELVPMLKSLRAAGGTAI